MSRYKILNSKEIKKIYAFLKSQWDISVKLDYAFVQSGDKILVINRDFVSIPLDNLRINSLGLYFGKISNDSFRLSIEGSQIIGPLAKKNVFKLSDEQFRDWIAGNDVPLDNLNSEFYILQHNDDFVGCGNFKNNKLYNYIPKSRRLSK